MIKKANIVSIVALFVLASAVPGFAQDKPKPNGCARLPSFNALKVALAIAT